MLRQIGLRQIGLGLARPAGSEGGSAPAPYRIVPNGETGAYVIAPHDDLGAIAYELTFANGADTSTPPGSIGTPFGGWRWTGTHHLDAVTDDPADPIATLHDDIGSTDSAMQANFGTSLFGGHYHGGIVLSSTDVPDMTSERYVSAFSVGYEATITWPTGETATVVYDLAIQADGNLAGSMTYTSTAVFTRAFLSMIIATAFDQFSTDGETFENGQPSGTYSLGSNSSVILRQGSTGYEIEVATDQDGLTNATNEIISDGTRLKHYVRKTSAGAALGTVSMDRMIAFRLTEPDPEPPADLFHWIGTEDGATWSEVPASAAVYLDSGDLVMERGTDAAVAYHRAIFEMTGLTENTSYRLPVSAEATPSGSAGCWLDIVPAATGSTNGAVASDFMANVIAAGYIDFTTGAGQTTLYAMVRQSPETSSTEVMRVSELGPLAQV